MSTQKRFNGPTAPSTSLKSCSSFNDQWQPRVVAEMNEYQFKLVRIEGDFIWHEHADTDETFIVLDGQLRIDLREDPCCSRQEKCSSCPRHGAQAVRRTRSQAAADRATRREEHR